jgi:drug/metabolite transporter (DMT)-like permease
MKNAKVHLVLFSVMLIYAITFSWAKDIMPEYITSSPMVAMRIGGALLLFWLLDLFKIEMPGNTKLTGIEFKDFHQFVIASIFGVTFNMLFFFKGLEITTPINGSVLMLNTPVFVLLIAFAFGKEKLSFMKVFGVLLAALGALLLMKGKAVSFSKETLPGDLMIVVNAIFFAFYLVYIKRLLVKYSLLTISRWTFLIGFLIMIPIAWNDFKVVSFAVIPLSIWFEILFIIIFTTFLAYLLNAWAIEKAGPVLVGSYIYLQPLLASIIAVFLGKDEMTWIKLIAALILFAGVFMTSEGQQLAVKKGFNRFKKNKIPDSTH